MKQWLKLIFLIASVSVIIMACGKSVEEQISEQLELGKRYLMEGNYEEAIVVFDKAIDLEPNTI